MKRFSGVNPGIRNGLPNKGPLSVITSVSCTKPTEKNSTVVTLCFSLFGQWRAPGIGLLSSSTYALPSWETRNPTSDHGAMAPTLPALPQVYIDLCFERLQITRQCWSLGENRGSVKGWLFLEDNGRTLWSVRKEGEKKYLFWSKFSKD